MCGISHIGRELDNGIENLMKMVMQTVREDCVVIIDTLENLGGSF